MVSLWAFSILRGGGRRPSCLRYFVQSMLIIGAAGASGAEGVLLTPEQGLEFLGRVAEVHDNTLKQLERLKLEYRRKVREVRFHNGEPFVLNSQVSAVEIHSRERAYYDAVYDQDYPNGNPGDFPTKWSRRVVLTPEYLASWTEGTDIAFAWERSEANAIGIDREVSMIRAPLLHKAFGDGNMTIRELTKFLELHDEWRVEVKRLGVEGPYVYEIAQFSGTGGGNLYRTITIAESRGYLTEAIRSYSAKGELRETIRIEGVPNHGLWLPRIYEIIEYGEHGEKQEGESGYGVVLRGELEVLSISFGETNTEIAPIDIHLVGVNDGHEFIVTDATGVQSRAVIYGTQFLPEEVYKSIVGGSAGNDRGFNSTVNVTTE